MSLTDWRAMPPFSSTEDDKKHGCWKRKGASGKLTSISSICSRLRMKQRLGWRISDSNKRCTVRNSHWPGSPRVWRISQLLSWVFLGLRFCGWLNCGTIAVFTSESIRTIPLPYGNRLDQTWGKGHALHYKPPHLCWPFHLLQRS